MINLEELLSDLDGSDAVIYYFLIDFWLMCTNILLHDLL